MADETLPDPTSLMLERQNRLGREMASLRDTVASLTNMLGLHHADLNGRLERIESSLRSMEQVVRGYAGEQITTANGLLNVQAEVSRAHRRLDGDTE